ncbi:Uncharacterised protein [Mycobacteroides abscessus subsp. massiliense]|nr:Uncharacterised protein [Mycobacteroides abscessus subsp. massiliense]
MQVGGLPQRRVLGRPDPDQHVLGMSGGHHECADVFQRRVRGTLLVVQALGDPVQQYLAVIRVSEQRAVDTVLVLLTIRGVQVAVEAQSGRRTIRSQITDLEELSRNTFGCRAPIFLVTDFRGVGPAD